MRAAHWTSSKRKWRNGRRAAFRSQCPKGRGGSNPPSRTVTKAPDHRSGAFVVAGSEVDADADALATRLRRECLALPVPTLAQTFDWVYAEKSPELTEQLARHEAYAASFEEAR